MNKTNSSGVYWANQFDNIINTEAHIQTTAKEIWSQTAGSIDGFTCAVGTGGTLAGVSIGLKNKNKNIKIESKTFFIYLVIWKQTQLFRKLEIHH